jgi:hypothetical protein
VVEGLLPACQRMVRKTDSHRHGPSTTDAVPRRKTKLLFRKEKIPEISIPTSAFNLRCKGDDISAHITIHDNHRGGTISCAMARNSEKAQVRNLDPVGSSNANSLVHAVSLPRAAGRRTGPHRHNVHAPTKKHHTSRQHSRRREMARPGHPPNLTCSHQNSRSYPSSSFSRDRVPN